MSALRSSGASLTFCVAALLLSVPFAAKAADAASDEQRQAFERIWGISEGRARPSRRDLKAAVKEDVIESSDSFEDDRRLRLRVQQERTRDALREVKLRRVVERKAAVPVESKRGDMTARVKSRVLGQKISGPVDLSSCEDLHLKARLGCTVRLRREARTTIQALEASESDAAEEVVVPDAQESATEEPVIRSQTSE